MSNDTALTNMSNAVVEVRKVYEEQTATTTVAGVGELPTLKGKIESVLESKKAEIKASNKGDRGNGVKGATGPKGKKGTDGGPGRQGYNAGTNVGEKTVTSPVTISMDSTNQIPSVVTSINDLNTNGGVTIAVKFPNYVKEA